MKARILLSVLTLLCLFFCAAASGQEWDALLEEAKSMGASGKYDSAVVLGELALKEALAEFGETDTSVARVLSRLGRYYGCLGEHFSAETLLVKALDIRIGAHGVEHSEVAHSMALLADAYNLQGRHAESERLFRRALAMMEKVLDPDDL
ncbi:MAG: tetratricopeptide repeat protein, partial [Candidatus Zixiibacteriota bacterium]